MEKKRCVTKSAIMVLLIREKDGKQQVLLQKRHHTGYKDGYYDFTASGHVEENESMLMACVRETKEEVGVTINKDNLEAMCVIHKHSTGEDTYYNGYFKIGDREGNPRIAEPNKCSELTWFDIDHLPDNLIEDRKIAIQNDIYHVIYDEYGWN